MLFEERWSKAYFNSGQVILGILTPFRKATVSVNTIAKSSVEYTPCC